MADNQDDKQRAKREFGSFKERILAELEEATRIRQEREERAYQEQLKQQEEANLLAQQLEKDSQPNLINTTSSESDNFETQETELLRSSESDHQPVSSEEDLSQPLEETSELASESSLPRATFVPDWNETDLAQVEKSASQESEPSIDETSEDDVHQTLGNDVHQTLGNDVHQVLGNIEEVLTPEVEKDDMITSESDVGADQASETFTVHPISGSDDQTEADNLTANDSAGLEADSLLDVTAGRTEVHQVLDNLEKVFSPELEVSEVSAVEPASELPIEPQVSEIAAASSEAPLETAPSVSDEQPETESIEVKLAQSEEFEEEISSESDSLLDVTAGRTEVHQVLDNLEKVFSPELEDDTPVAFPPVVEKPTAEAEQEVSKEAPVSEVSSEVAVSESDEEELEESVGKRRKKKLVQKKRQRRESLAKKLALYIISITLVILLAVGGFGAYYISNSLKPVNSKSTDYVQVEIPAGSGTKMIGQILEKKGLIRNATIFNYYSKFKNYSNYQSGYFNLQKSMSLDEIAKALQKEGTTSPTQPVLGKVLIKEGYTIEQIAKAIEVNANSKKSSKTPYSASDFLKLMKDESFIKEMVEKYPKLLANLPSKDEAVYQLEGYLFPATYDYYKATSLKDLVDTMLQTMDTTLSNYYTTISEKGMTVNQVLTLASLVEKEGQTDEDRRTIASVFYNRLNAGQALQSNIAVLYAMGKLGETITLSEDANIDTSIDSPYNDYTHTGLMPGPVDSPGLSAIKAVLNPESTDYYYFVADVKTGKVYYANDYETHQKNVEKYVNSQISN